MSWVFVFQICDIAINWAGGLHHAKKFEVSEEVMWETVATRGLVFWVTVGGGIVLVFVRPLSCHRPLASAMSMTL